MKKRKRSLVAKARPNLGSKKPRNAFEKMLSEITKGSECERMLSAITGYRRVRK